MPQHDLNTGDLKKKRKKNAICPMKHKRKTKSMINRKTQDKMAVSSPNIIASAISVNELNIPNNIATFKLEEKARSRSRSLKIEIYTKRYRYLENREKAECQDTVVQKKQKKAGITC